MAAYRRRAWRAALIARIAADGLFWAGGDANLSFTTVTNNVPTDAIIYHRCDKYRASVIYHDARKKA